jgi:hypothetical protein
MLSAGESSLKQTIRERTGTASERVRLWDLRTGKECLVCDPIVDELVNAIRDRELRASSIEQIGDNVSFIAEDPLPMNGKRTGGHYQIRMCDVRRAIELVRSIKKPHKHNICEVQLKLLDILNKLELEACT